MDKCAIKKRLWISTLAAALLLCTGTAGSAQFYATQDDNGELTVVDEGGAEVPIATADPIGQRPDVCPSNAYHVVEAPSDRSKLILTDCATGEGQYTVEMRDDSDAN